MPGISDPGSELIAAARAARRAGRGAARARALRTAVALLSGFPLRRFTFEGFPPRSRRGAARAFRATRCEPTPRRSGTSRRSGCAPPRRPRGRSRPTRKSSSCASTPSCTSSISGERRSSVIAQLPDPVRGEVAFAIAPYASRGRSGRTDRGDECRDRRAARRRTARRRGRKAARGARLRRSARALRSRRRPEGAPRKLRLTNANAAWNAPTTSRRRSTTSAAIRTSATPTRRSSPTCSRARRARFARRSS